MGGKIDRSINVGGAPPIFKINGQNFHLIGSLLPLEGNQPKFAQLYIHDTQHDITNRISSVRYVIVDLTMSYPHTHAHIHSQTLLQLM